MSVSVNYPKMVHQKIIIFGRLTLMGLEMCLLGFLWNSGSVGIFSSIFYAFFFYFLWVSMHVTRISYYEPLASHTSHTCEMFSDWFKSGNSQKSQQKILLYVRESSCIRTVLWLVKIREFPEIPAQNSPVWELFSDWFKFRNSYKSRRRILLYESCSLIRLNPGISINPGTDFSCMRTVLWLV